MKRSFMMRNKLIILLLCLMAFSFAVNAVQFDDVAALPHTGDILIRFKPDYLNSVDLDTLSMEEEFSTLGVKTVTPLLAPGERSKIMERLSMSDTSVQSNEISAGQVYLLEMEDKSGSQFEIALGLLKKDDRLLYAEPNYIVHTSLIPDDTRWGELWGMNRISAPAAWDTQTDAGMITVAVIDTGVDDTHPDLAGICVAGYDFANDDNDPMDDHGHGTHCAGIIGALGNNHLGVTGVCWNIRIMPLKFLSSYGGGSIANAVRAINFAIANGADIMSNSWGGWGFSAALRDAITDARDADILFIAAAGNDANNNDNNPFYPASYKGDKR
jgi:subtilisin family serine protease